jgi:putative hydrolase of the HAD superfamily
MIKTIIFDLGNVIVPVNFNLALVEMEKVCGLSVDEIREKVFALDALKKFETGQIDSDDFFAAMCELLNLQIEFADFCRIWNSIFTLEPIVPESLLANLAERYCLLALSDSNPIHLEFIEESFPIMRHFADVISSCQTGVTKPAAKMYLAAVEKAGCRPEECLFTDDRAGNVEGALKAGLDAFQFLDIEQFKAELQQRNIDF